MVKSRIRPDQANSQNRFLFLKTEIFSALRFTMAKIVIIDDEPAMVEVIVTLCREKGHQVFPFNSASKAVEQLDSIAPQVVIADIKMETMTGFDVLRHVREHHRQTAVILITAYGTVETAVEAMKMGAYDYVTKPFKIDELQLTVQRALDYQAALRENVYLRKELKNRYRFENIIGTSGKMQSVYNLISKVADTDSTVLIVGESGTGKELVARGLHFNSNRQHHPFVAINCSALPENLLESELFGHKKGSFTGAVVDKRGLFEEANLGTIFLDEVNSMAPALQTKLLRVLQEREVRRVGDNKSSPVNVRVVGATNEALQPKLKDGTFREDLYYRLAVIPIDLPALRERLEDVPLLVNHFLQKQASATGGEPKKIDAEAVDILCHYNYPGNVRELENAIERAWALCENDLILSSDLPPHIVSHAKGDKQDQVLASMPVGQSLDDFVQQQERNYIEATLQHCDGSREKAANMLGISMATLYRKIEPKKK
jgi:DNA-binding NtrC family response regulator